jgi:zinc protease
MKRAVAGLSLLLASVSVAAGKPDLTKPPVLPPAPSWRAPTPVAATTTSGTKVVMLPERELPLVQVLVTVAAGSALDPPAHPGLAAATAMMLQDGGAGKRSAPELAAALAALGAELRVSIDVDQVQLQLTVLARNLDQALGLIGDLLARPRLDAAEWPKARARRIDEIRRHLDEPPILADEEFRRVVYGDHPYAHPSLGTPDSVAAISIDDVRKFYAAHYGPRTVAFVLVGDTALASAVPAVTQALGDWPSTAAPPTQPPPAPALPKPGAARLVVVDRPGAPQSEIRVGHIGRDRKTADFAALQLLQTVLGGAFTSRLNLNLREKHGYTYGVRAHFELKRVAGPFMVRAAVRTDATAASLQETVNELAGIRAPLAAEEVKKGRSLVQSAIVEAFADGLAAAGLIADLVTYNLLLDFWSRVPDELIALDGDELTRAAGRLFFPDRLTIVVVGDRKAIDASLQKLAFPKSIEYRDVVGKLTK